MKRGFQLSIGFIVTLIITLVIFIGSIYFLGQFYSATEEFREEIDRNSEAELRALIRDGSIVAIPINKANLKISSGKSFWIGIHNILQDEKDFGVQVDWSGAYSHSGQEILEASAHITDTWVLYSEGPHIIPSNEFVPVPIRIVVGDTVDGTLRTPKGTYSFNVCVYDRAALPQGIGQCQSGINKELLYTNKIYTIFVEVN